LEISYLNSPLSSLPSVLSLYIIAFIFTHTHSRFNFSLEWVSWNPPITLDHLSYYFSWDIILCITSCLSLLGAALVLESVAQVGQEEKRKTKKVVMRRIGVHAILALHSQGWAQYQKHYCGGISTWNKIWLQRDVIISIS
jgi:hypothetical protein